MEDPRAQFGHLGMALISDQGAAEVTNQCPPRYQTKDEGFNLLYADSGYLIYLEAAHFMITGHQLVKKG